MHHIGEDTQQILLKCKSITKAGLGAGLDYFGDADLLHYICNYRYNESFGYEANIISRIY